MCVFHISARAAKARSLDGKQIIPSEWVKAATMRSAPY